MIAVGGDETSKVGLQKAFDIMTDVNSRRYPLSQSFSKWAIATPCGALIAFSGAVKDLEEILGAKLCRKQRRETAIQCGLY